jgi:Mn2+/Fe2+ NRAMP family transporter
VTGAERGLARYWRLLGPGLVAGASDCDPTTVATMAVAGASTGYTLAWLVVLVYPMLASVQVVSAQVGRATRTGLQSLVVRTYGARWGAAVLVSVLGVNLFTIGADLQAGAAALGLLTGVDLRWFVIPYALLVAVVLFKGRYGDVERVLKYVLLVFVAYAFAAFLARPDWLQVGRGMIPTLKMDSAHIQVALAVVGTTLTAYAFLWEVQEEAEHGQRPRTIELAKTDAAAGMLFAVAIFWFILVATGATLGAHNHHVETAQDAAAALAPFAGQAATYVFAVGLLASSMVAVPILASTSAYLLAQQFRVPGGLSLRPNEAPLFYAAIGLSLLVAIGVGLLNIPSIKLLFWASIAGGIGAPISLAFLLLLARRPDVMGDRQVSLLATSAGWATFVIVTILSLYFVGDQLIQRLTASG